VAALPEGIEPAVVVDVHVRFSTSLTQYHVRTSVQSKVGNHVVYERDQALEGSWADVVAFLSALLSSPAADIPVADHYESLISA